MSPVVAIVIVLAIIGAYYVYARQGASGAALPYVPPPASAPASKPPASKVPASATPDYFTYNGLYSGLATHDSTFTIKAPTQESCTAMCKASTTSCDFAMYDSAGKNCVGHKLPARADTDTLVKTPSGYYKYPGTQVTNAPNFGAKLPTEAGCTAFCDASTGCVVVNVSAKSNQCSG